MYRTVWGKGKTNFDYLTDFTFIFDVDGNVAGMQSTMPLDSFNLDKPWQCTDNEFYQAANFTFPADYFPHPPIEREYCVATIYFRHPSTINTKGYKADPSKDILYLQKGDSYDDANLVAFPKRYEDAVKNNPFWKKDKFFLGMGHHITRHEQKGKTEYDCMNFMPIQGLYAHVDGECINTGFVWQHANTFVKDKGMFSPDGKKSLEAPPSMAVRAIINDPPKCETDLADIGYVKTQHVFLGGSTTYCYTY